MTQVSFNFVFSFLQKINSIFKNYGNDSITKLLDYKNHIDNNRMIIIADGDIIKNNLRVIDLTAATLCFDNRIPVVIFGLNDKNSIVRAVGGEKIGTVVTVG